MIVLCHQIESNYVVTYLLYTFYIFGKIKQPLGRHHSNITIRRPCSCFGGLQFSLYGPFRDSFNTWVSIHVALLAFEVTDATLFIM